MRIIPFTLAVVLAGAFARTAAETLAVPALPEPAFADTEVSEGFAFRTGEAADGCLRVRIALDAGATNALSVAFGTDVMSHALFQFVQDATGLTVFGQLWYTFGIESCLPIGWWQFGL